MKENARILPRGRISQWSRERIDKLSTAELRALLINAERLKETEVAALCNEILNARPRGHAPARRDKRGLPAHALVTRTKAFEMHGVSPRNRTWSRGGVRTDGAVVLALRVDEVQPAGVGKACLLWGPNVGGSRPWSDSPGGQERLEHCRMALERGAAEGLLIYGAKTDRVDAQTVLKLQVEKRDDEYWATWVPQKHVVVREVG
jgi:hypothetical protein